MHNSSNGTSQLCSFNRNTPRKSPGKVKSALRPRSFAARKDFFLLRKGRVTRRSSRQSVRRDAASRRIHGTFAAPFRPTKLQRDFHKAQRRVGPREHAGDSRAAREGSVRRGGARRGEREAAKWKRNFAIRRENSWRELSLSSLDFAIAPTIFSAYVEKHGRSSELVFHQFREAYVSLINEKV